MRHELVVGFFFYFFVLGFCHSVIVSQFFFGYNDRMTDNDNTSGDNAYKWVIRSLYTVAIGLNVWYTVEHYRGTPEGVLMQDRAAKLVNTLRHPITEAKKLRRMEQETIVEAWVVVDEAKREAGETDEK